MLVHVHTYFNLYYILPSFTVFTPQVSNCALILEQIHLDVGHKDKHDRFTIIKEFSYGRETQTSRTGNGGTYPDAGDSSNAEPYA